MNKTEGVIQEDGIFDLSLSDAEVISLVKKKVETAESFWEKADGHNISKVRKNNENYWRGDQIDKRKLYGHNVPYVENKVFVDIETANSIVNSRTPEPEVYPAQDTITSKQIAEDLEKALLAHSEKHNVQDKFRYVLRHMKLFRIGVMKLRWDENYGRIGDIIPEYILPEDVVVSTNTRPGENPDFVCHYLNQTLEELIIKFPDKKDELFKKLNIVKGVTSQLGQIIRYKEIWFTYYQDGRPEEGVAWMFNDIVLGKMQNPDYVYAQDKEYEKNFFEEPRKPFIFFSYLNLGRHLLDDTSELEQAIPMQDVLNKRGKQIVENADHANGTWVFGKGFSAADAEELTGDPEEKILIDTDNVNNAVSKLGGTQLPNYVLEDKMDARNSVDNMFSIHPITTGGASTNRTLGQDQLQIQQDMSRQDEMVRCFESGIDDYYKTLTQMMKVYYTEEHMFRVTGEDGQFDSVVMKADNIEDGIDVKVKVGSSLPLDKATIRKTSLEMAGMGMIDPQTLFEDLGLPNAKKRMERLLKWKMDPASFADDIKREDFERDAFLDIQILNRNKVAPPRKAISAEHLAYHTTYMMGREYREQKDEIKQKHIDHVTLETEDLRQTADLQATQLPTNQDVLDHNNNLPPAPAPAVDQNGQPVAPPTPPAGPDGQPTPPPEPQGPPQGPPQAPPAPPVAPTPAPAPPVTKGAPLPQNTSKKPTPVV